MGVQPTTPGWYDDPEGRYSQHWDGEKWTAQKKARKKHEVEEVPLSSYVMKLIGAIAVGLFLALFDMVVLAGLAIGAADGVKWTMGETLFVLGVALVTGLLYYGMYREMRKFKPRKKPTASKPARP